ncbi:MAG TPA: TonB-dependent receptor [Longimicrobiales bacterium]|nr:TonB-dependent receptor [Longimicrobiales bacterium]
MLKDFRKSWMGTLAMLLLAAVPAYGQTGSVTGRVTSAATGQGVPLVQVQVINAASIIVARTSTGDDGSYLITSVSPGVYTIAVTNALGYQESRTRDVRVAAGQSTRVDIQLATGALSLDQIVVSVSGVTTTLLEAPEARAVVERTQIENRIAVTPAAHLEPVPAVDIARTGISSSNVVIRGFNNIFSGAVQMMTDHRIAGVPSLRVNFMQLIPANNEDIERVELILGPGAALYGPNTANGIVHFMTRSPIQNPGNTFSVAGGERDLMQAEFRTAHRISEQVGVKVSGNFLRGTEWRYTDPVEVAEAAKFAGPQGAAFREELQRITGITDASVLEGRISRIGDRDDTLRRWGGEVRVDWQPTDAARMIFSGGRSELGRSIELTGLGAGQAIGWSNSFVQARGEYGSLFAQGYVNFSDAGETYLLRDGAPIRDKSRLWVGQLQHGLSLSPRQSFVYGADLLYTDPRTEGTIHGIYEDEDQTTEVGGYIQSTTSLTDQLRLILAGRVDSHTGLPDPVFSPRAALVFNPRETQSVRVAFNRAFSTPSSLNQFLHLGSAMPDPNAARLGYSLLIQGTGTRGFSFGEPGTYQMRSPFTPAAMGGPAQLLSAGAAAAYFPATVQVLAQAGAPAAFPDYPWLFPYLAGLTPTPSEVSANYSIAGSGQSHPLAELTLEDVPAIRESTQNTFEVGYTGIFGDRVRFSADFWFNRRQNFVTPLSVITPLVLLNGPQLGAFLATRFVVDRGMSPEEAGQLAAALVGGMGPVPGMATIPVGVISSEDVAAHSAQLLVTYYNVDDDLDTYGTDIMAQANLTDVVYARGGVSLVNKNVFETRRGATVTLNAAKEKFTGAVGYMNPVNRLNGEVSARYTGEYPVRSGVYNATACIGGTEPGREECVPAMTIVDVNFGIGIPQVPGATLQFTVQNALDSDYRPFPGMPRIGRLALARLRYNF